jgi:hypothetical protein
MARKASRAERRALVERLLLADPQMSDRAVARASGSSHFLAGTVRGELVAAGRIEPRPARPAGSVQVGHPNLTRQEAGVSSPRLEHGGRAETALAEARVRYLEELRERHPEADDAVLRAQAGRLARHDVLTDFLDRVGVAGLLRRDGELRPQAALIGQLEVAIERCSARLAGEGAGGVSEAEAAYAEYQRITERKEQS